MTQLEFPFETQLDRLLARCAKYHNRNPRVWIRFQQIADALRARGVRSFGARAICERIRWERALEDGRPFPLPGDFSAFYARAYYLSRPGLNGFFGFARLRSGSYGPRPAGRSAPDDPIDPQLEKWIRTTFGIR